MAARWLGCTSRGFDLSPLFCSVLDHARGGAFKDRSWISGRLVRRHLGNAPPRMTTSNLWIPRMGSGTQHR